MAFTATMQWDVRTTGSDSNGGGFDTSASGTDRSQSDTPFVTYTDLVIGGTNTQITSAANPFGATSPGNIINITGGTGFTVQRVQIVSVAGAVATCDKAVGTGGSTGGQGKLGGALQTLAAAAALVVAENTVNVKAGTYALTASVVIPGVNHSWIGYGATHGDDGTRPLITTATNSTHLFDHNSNAGTVLYRNLSFSNTASTRSSGINAGGFYPALVVSRCIFDGFTHCIYSDAGYFAFTSVFGCEFKNFTINGITSNFRTVVYGCWFHDSSTGGSTAINQQSGGASVAYCLFTNLKQGVALPDGSNNLVANCTFYKCSANALSAGTELAIVDNIFYFNNIGVAGGGKGFEGFNAFGAQTSTNRTGTYYFIVSSDIALSADPFTNAAGNDFSLNSTAGGAACKGTGYPGVFPGGLTTGSLNLGAVQTAGSSGGGQRAYPVL